MAEASDSPSSIDVTATQICDYFARGSFKKVPNCAASFLQDCPLKNIRTATMELITTAHAIITAIKGGNSANTIQQIMLEFDKYVSDQIEEMAEKTSAVSQNIWDKCLRIVMPQTPSNNIHVVDKLFCIRDPESDDRKAAIYNTVQDMLDKRGTFHDGLKWIQTLNLGNLKQTSFDMIVYKSLMYGYEKVLDETLITSAEKLQCLRVLDGCLRRVDENRINNEIEKEFIKFITVEKLATLIGKKALDYEIDVEGYKFNACRALFIQKMKENYLSLGPHDFEMFALNALKNRPVTNKLDFLQILSDDIQYASCWAKYLEIDKKKLPDFLIDREKYDKIADDFVEDITQQWFDSGDVDCVLHRKFWGKSYKLITIVSAQALSAFILEYFIVSKPKVMGIDCEAGMIDGKHKITVLQLATTDWLCLIDVQLLYEKYTEDQWEILFKYIFDPEIIRVGFHFLNDFRYLCNGFPFLQKFFQEKERKVFCLHKLVNERSPMNGNFNNTTNSGLKQLAKEVLKINVKKSLQSSNWTKRPLESDQKIYAVTDALVAVLIYEKKEAQLKEKYGDAQAAAIMEKAYVYCKNF